MTVLNERNPGSINGNEIRLHFELASNRVKSERDMDELKIEVLAEIAAQLADYNAHIKSIDEYVFKNRRS